MPTTKTDPIDPTEPGPLHDPIFAEFPELRRDGQAVYYGSMNVTIVPLLSERQLRAGAAIGLHRMLVVLDERCRALEQRVDEAEFEERRLLEAKVKWLRSLVSELGTQECRYI